MKSETTSNAIPRTSRRPPEPPKIVPKSWKIDAGNALNWPRSKFGEMSILDNPPMVLDDFSRAGPSLDHQNLIKNHSRNHSINIHRKREVHKPIFNEKWGPETSQMGPRIHEKSSLDLQGTTLGIPRPLTSRPNVSKASPEPQKTSKMTSESSPRTLHDRKKQPLDWVEGAGGRGL